MFFVYTITIQKIKTIVFTNKQIKNTKYEGLVEKRIIHTHTYSKIQNSFFDVSQ